MGLGLGLTVQTPFMGGGGGFSPADESGLAVWFDATVGTTTDEDGVNSFVSQDTNAWEVVQVTGAKKPELAVAYQNGLDAILFDGVDDSLRKVEPGDVLIDADAFTLFIAFKPMGRHATLTQAAFYWESNHGGGGWNNKYDIRQTSASGTDPDYFGHGAAIGTNKKDESDVPNPPGALIGANHILHYRVDIDAVADDNAWIKNQNVYGSDQSASKTTIFSSGKMRIGEYNGGPYFSGYIYEIVGYTEKKSVETCTTIYDYLNARWGIYA